MSDVATAIMNAAERHIRVGGYDAFSFRDLATEVGVKSSSVHYHFPTKEKLAASVIRRYSEQVSSYIDELEQRNLDPVQIMTDAFATTVRPNIRLCPCVVLGAAVYDLPEEVSAEVRAYYEMWFRRLEAMGLARERATVYMSSLLGGQLLAAVQDDPKAFDAAAREVLREHAAVAA